MKKSMKTMEVLWKKIQRKGLLSEMKRKEEEPSLEPWIPVLQQKTQ